MREDLSYYGVAKSAWGNSMDHFLEFVSMNTEPVKCSRLGELAMRSVR